MNELLTLVHDFNQTHKADAFFSYAGHVEQVHVSVNEPETLIKNVFEGDCYLDQDYGQYPTIEALTKAFRKFVEGYQE